MAFPTAINDQISAAVAARHAQLTQVQAERRPTESRQRAERRD